MASPAIRFQASVDDVRAWVAGPAFLDDSIVARELLAPESLEAGLHGPECSPTGDELDAAELKARDTALLLQAGAMDVSGGAGMIAALSDSARRAPTGPSLLQARVLAVTQSMLAAEVSRTLKEGVLQLACTVASEDCSPPRSRG